MNNSNQVWETAMPKAPEPKGPLGRYRLLAPTAAVRVSPLCLGGMNFGNAWKNYMDSCDRETVETMLDFFYDQGGNFIDTSNNYQMEESETWIGEWMERRGVRDQMVIATKYTANYRAGLGMNEIMANRAGNGAKSLHVSVNDSLLKLKTGYIDLLYVHFWDYTTSVSELMQSLNQLVLSGKVLYLGASDTPAWVISKANEYARNHGLRQFSVYQGRWSAACRDLERDVIPMCRDEGMALAPWGTLGEGTFKTEAQRQLSRNGRQQAASALQVRISNVLEAIADRKGTAITSVALAYVMHKAPYVFPIIGGRNIEHLKQNIDALCFSLDDNDIARIEEAVPFDLGFPHNYLWRDGMPQHPAQVRFMDSACTVDHVPLPNPISPTIGGD